MAGKKYTPLEDKILREYYPTMTARQVSKMIDRTEHSVSHRAEFLGLKKHKEFFNKEPKIIEIFVTQTFHIYESKINFME